MDEIIEDFKLTYRNKGPGDLSGQIKYLAALADYYHEEGAKYADWVRLLKAHSLYNSSAARETGNPHYWAREAYQVQLSFWPSSVTCTYEKQSEITNRIATKLSKIREETRSRLNDITKNSTTFECEPERICLPHSQEQEEKFMTQVMSLSKDCTGLMVDLFKLIIEEAVGIVGKPVCKFCAAALGSVARGEATPYSDLEFLFLVERKSDQVTEYFVKLAVTIYFLIGNLQETKLQYMAIDELAGWFNDCSINGLKIDGLQKRAGNIPTGNGSQEQHNHLICTVEELLAKYQAILRNPTRDSISGDLTAMLPCTALIYGESALLDEFSDKIQMADRNENGFKTSAQMLMNDIGTYNFYPNCRLQTKLNMKGDLYRYPSLLLLNLRILLQMKKPPIDCFGELIEKGFLSPLNAHRLRFSLCCAIYVRLSTYLHHSSQKEDITTADRREVGLEFHTEYWHVERPLLMQMLIHLMPRKKNSMPFMENDEHSSVAESEYFLAVVCYHCKEYSKCYSLVKSLWEVGSYVGDLDARFMLVECARKMSRHSEAVKVARGTLAILRRCKRYGHPSYSPELVSVCFNQFGQLGFSLAAYELSCQSYKKALHTENQLLNTKSASDGYAARIHGNLAVTYMSLQRFGDAENHLLLALNGGRLQDTKLDDPTLLTLLKHLTEVELALGETRKAYSYCMKMIGMQRWLYGEAHPTYSESYELLSQTLYKANCYLQSLHYRCLYTKNVEKYGSQSDLERVADMYLQLSQAYNRLLKPECAGLFSVKYARLCHKIGRRYDDPVSANLYRRMGNKNLRRGNHREAIFFFAIFVELTQSRLGKVDCEEIAACYDGLANAYSQLQYDAAALHHQRECLEMRQRLHPAEDHSDVATALNNLGNAYLQVGDYNKALEQYEAAIKMKHQLYKTSNHPSVAVSYNNMGNVHYTRHNLRLAEKCYITALRIRHQTYGDSDHKDVASSYFNMGSLRQHQGCHKVAELYYKRCLEMRERLFCQTNHPDIAEVCRSLSRVYACLKVPEKNVYYFNRYVEIMREFN